MKLVSWNVNGFRSILSKGFQGFFAEAAPDVICLQETRIPEEDARGVELPVGFQAYWSAAEKKGYSGTAVFSRFTPLGVTRGLGGLIPDREGRVITLEFESFFLVNVYTPNSRRDLARLAYRTQEWDVAFRAYLKQLELAKPVLFCGDLNVAHREVDLAHPKSNQKNAGFTPEERSSFCRLLDSGFVDTFRMFEPGPGHYTWWSYQSNARARNIGWRIDYVCASARLKERVQKAFILPSVMGSDHCPVGVVLGPPAVAAEGV